jgi:hypothetical protein
MVNHICVRECSIDTDNVAADVGKAESVKRSTYQTIELNLMRCSSSHDDAMKKKKPTATTVYRMADCE